MSTFANILTKAVIALIVSTASTQAQTVETNFARDPSPNESLAYSYWDISFSRRDSPKSFEFDSSHKTLAAAQAEAEEIKRWSRKMRWDDLKVATIVLTERAGYRASPGGNVRSRSGRRLSPVERLLANGITQTHEAVDQALDLAPSASPEINMPGNVLSEYNEVVQTSYESAVELKKGLVALQGKLTDTQFAQVDRMIDQMVEYKAEEFLAQQQVGAAKLIVDEQAERSREAGARVNGLLDELSRTSDPVAQRRLRDELRKLEASGELRASLLTESDHQAARDEHKAAQDHVDVVKGILAQAEHQRQEIVRKAMRGSGGAGPFQLFTGQYSNTADVKGGGSGRGFASLEQAQREAQQHMSKNSSRQPSYRIEDRNGNVIEARGLLRTLTAARGSNEMHSLAGKSLTGRTTGVKELNIGPTPQSFQFLDERRVRVSNDAGSSAEGTYFFNGEMLLIRVGAVTVTGSFSGPAFRANWANDGHNFKSSFTGKLSG
ncbi:MAG: hypothetical protein KDA75_08555 [Planctomycetaceae bacterium]|nr:hypothetical protein [Planctomycetaceae bacterium]